MIEPRAELHFHLLPDIDDGPSDEAEAVVLARAAVADGTGTVVCTPHARCVRDGAELTERVAQLRDALAREAVGLELRVGAELAADDVARFGAADLDALAQGPPHARWLLIEAPLEPHGVGALHDAIGESAARGFGVLLAHPERCGELLAVGGGLQALRAAGVGLQVNASSLTGAHGGAARNAALSLVSRGAATILASDAHGPQRPPSLTAAVALLTGAEVPGAEHLVGAVPHALLRRGLPVPGEASRRALVSLRVSAQGAEPAAG